MQMEGWIDGWMDGCKWEQNGWKGRAVRLREERCWDVDWIQAASGGEAESGGGGG